MPEKSAESTWKNLPPRALLSFYRKLKADQLRKFDQLRQSVSAASESAAALQHDIDFYQAPRSPLSPELLLEKRLTALKGIEKQRQVYSLLGSVAAHLLKHHSKWLVKADKAELREDAKSIRTELQSLKSSLKSAKSYIGFAAELKRSAIKEARGKKQMQEGKPHMRAKNIVDARSFFRRPK